MSRLDVFLVVLGVGFAVLGLADLVGGHGWGGAELVGGCLIVAGSSTSARRARGARGDLRWWRRRPRR
ncbi:hypothetical protein B0I12_001932 [Microbacterium hydrothermale]|uniref:hypothetical protein n=1 Tax=Microbacterium hydrothermale TaxID=857427 RepID=UPI0022278E0E|nr:hypothetical protein [Microbacterium hydrothermale]MCW2164797.1 hypothetical protein [Microbacterium hydrothermale]